MGLFLSPMGFRSMPVAVQLGRGLGATHGRWSCDRGGKERTRCATSEVYTRKLSKLLKKKQNSQKAFWKFTTSSGKKTDYLLWLHLHTFYSVSLFCLVDPQINKRETVLFANVTKQKKKELLALQWTQWSRDSKGRIKPSSSHNYSQIEPPFLTIGPQSLIRGMLSPDSYGRVKATKFAWWILIFTRFYWLSFCCFSAVQCFVPKSYANVCFSSFSTMGITHWTYSGFLGVNGKLGKK